MAKNVFFDSIDYLVDDSLLATAKDALKTHFSSTLVGSGAVINFGGIDYNIDSAKLGTARTDLVNHFGTISGSGRKVKVGSVEYGIDNTKTADATAQIHAVLSGMMSGGSISNYRTQANEYGTTVIIKSYSYALNDLGATVII